jgi:hypothetical protein
MDWQPITFEAAFGLVVGVLCYKIYRSKCHERFKSKYFDVELVCSGSNPVVSNQATI